MGLITSRELVIKYNISYQTLNFYTTIGLLEIHAKIGSRRLYDEENTRSRLEKISALKDEGYPLRIILKQLAKEFFVNTTISASPIHSTQETGNPTSASNATIFAGTLKARTGENRRRSIDLASQSGENFVERKGGA